MRNLKKQVAEAALEHLGDVSILGVGTGSTTAYFIQALAGIKQRIEGCVASSKATEAALREAGLPVINLAAADPLRLYVDGADEVTQHKRMIKGGGGALTHEKIIATASTHFICLVDESKVVRRLGAFPVAVEVLPMARSLVARALVKLGGSPVYREGFVTDSGNYILDVFQLNLDEPIAMERAIKLLPGVVDSGIFAERPADTVLVARASGVDVF
ncbi:MAG: ribose-5-phosphate isomerase RpiA [Gammaproteobacteria bacterium]|nr:ribose-5-phosphate isomerase RpiA [Gammaproteobacteria bacterium]